MVQVSKSLRQSHRQVRILSHSDAFGFLKISCDSGIYEYYGISPYQRRRLTGLLKRGYVGKFWQYIRRFDGIKIRS